MKNQEYSVLDHGLVRVVDLMGNDISITQAARVSYGEGTKGLRQDEKLIRYLMRNKHTSPFEMCEIKFHIKAPIFIARQWLRHRTANVNEYSARYSIMRSDYYLPSLEQMRAQSRENKQGRGELLEPALAKVAHTIIEEASQTALKHYHTLLSLGEEGLARELARIILPLNIYTEFYWKIDLHNLLHFIELRIDEHAQYEIQEYARVLLKVVQAWLPLTYQAFKDYRLEGKKV